MSPEILDPRIMSPEIVDEYLYCYKKVIHVPPVKRAEPRPRLPTRSRRVLPHPTGSSVVAAPEMFVLRPKAPTRPPVSRSEPESSSGHSPRTVGDGVIEERRPARLSSTIRRIPRARSAADLLGIPRRGWEVSSSSHQVRGWETSVAASACNSMPRDNI